MEEGYFLIVVVNTEKDQYGIWARDDVTIKSLRDLENDNYIVFEKLNGNDNKIVSEGKARLFIIDTRRSLFEQAAIGGSGKIIEVYQDKKCVLKTAHIVSLMGTRYPLEGKIEF